MASFISLPEAAHRYSLSEKTLHNWINKGWLQADKVLVNGRRQYLIDPAKIETVMADRNMLALLLAHTSTSQNDTDTIARFEALEQRIRELEHRVRTLETSEPPPRAIPTPQPSSSKLVRVHHANYEKESNPIPDGCVSFYHFLHGMSDGSSGRWKNEQSTNLVQTGLWHGSSGHLVKVILTPEGQLEYYRWAKGRKGFKQCDLCPHGDN